MTKIVSNFPWTITRDMPPEIFVVWLCKSLHVQVSHLRMLKVYAARFEYRINRLTANQMQALSRLLDCIQVDASASRSELQVASPLPVQASPPRTPRRKSASVDELFGIFGGASSHSDTKPLTPRPTPEKAGSKHTVPVDQLFELFGKPDGIATKRTRPSNDLVNSDVAPPPPAHRGAIKAKAQQTALASMLTATSGSASSVTTASVMRAFTPGRERSCLRVTTPSDGKHAWIEVSLRQSPRHFEIVCKVRDAVLAGKVNSKAEAVLMKDQLLKAN